MGHLGALVLLLNPFLRQHRLCACGVPHAIWVGRQFLIHGSQSWSVRTGPWARTALGNPLYLDLLEGDGHPSLGAAQDVGHLVRLHGDLWAGRGRAVSTFVIGGGKVVTTFASVRVRPARWYGIPAHPHPGSRKGNVTASDSSLNQSRVAVSVCNCMGQEANTGGSMTLVVHVTRAASPGPVARAVTGWVSVGAARHYCKLAPQAVGPLPAPHLDGFIRVDERHTDVYAWGGGVPQQLAAPPVHPHMALRAQRRQNKTATGSSGGGCVIHGRTLRHAMRLRACGPLLRVCREAFMVPCVRPSKDIKAARWRRLPLASGTRGCVGAGGRGFEVRSLDTQQLTRSAAHLGHLT